MEHRRESGRDLIVPPFLTVCDAVRIKRCRAAGSMVARKAMCQIPSFSVAGQILAFLRSREARALSIPEFRSYMAVALL